jgi:ribosomal protein S18 acetylase RimI-like enzyme
VKVEPDAWLANIFGYPVFKVSFVAEEKNVSADEFTKVISGQTAFLYAKIPTTRIDQVRALTAAGFNVIDVNVAFERAPASRDDGAKRILTVREIRADEHTAVLKIAETSFVYSRFHLDPQIPNRLANAVKRAWIESYCNKERGECLLVAQVKGKPAGFLAVLRATINGESVRVIDLIAVDKSYQNHGVGSALIDFIIHDPVLDYDRLRVGTQAANIPSLQFYEKLGFRIVKTTFVAHAHFRNGEVLR